MTTTDQTPGNSAWLRPAPVEDPTAHLWEHLSELRESREVLEGVGGRFADVPELPNAWMIPDDRPTFLTLTFEHARHVLTEPAVWSSDRGGAEPIVMGERPMSGSDDPHHKRLRDLVMPTFRKSTMERWRTDCIEPTLADLMASLKNRTRADLIADLTFPFPFRVTAGVIGFDPGIHEEAYRLTAAAWAAASDVEAGIEAGNRLRDLMDTVLTHWEQTPGNNLVTDFLNAEVNGQRLEREEILTLMRLLATASSDTTNRNGHLLLYGLLTNPAQLALLRADRSLLPRAIEEQLRWEPGGPMLPRVATCDTQLGDVKIPKGSYAIACATMANRDPSRWEHPDTFDITRTPQLNLSFGAGPHSCPGQHLAKEMIAAETTALLDQFPVIMLDPDQPPPVVTGVLHRSPGVLPVLLG